MSPPRSPAPPPFFSNDQAPIGSRTVRFLSGIHFPPGVMNVESAPLYGIENTNRGCGFNVNYLDGQSLAVPTLLNTSRPGLGILTGKADLYDSDSAAVNPGGVPIFKNNHVAGGIGVVAAAGTPNYNAIVEYAAVAGTFGNGYGLNPVPYPGAVVVNGITLPFVNQTTRPAGLTQGIASGAYLVGPGPATGPAPEGDLIAERGSTLGGLTLAQVQQIVQNTVAVGNTTRAAIRLPVGVRAKFVISVADLDGSLLAPLSHARRHDLQRRCRRRQVPRCRLLQRLTRAGDLPGVPAGTPSPTARSTSPASPSIPTASTAPSPAPSSPSSSTTSPTPAPSVRSRRIPTRTASCSFPAACPSTSTASWSVA